MTRLASIALASFGAALALLLRSSLPLVLAVAAPVTAGVLLVHATGGVPVHGPASLDVRRVDRAVTIVVVAVALSAVAYVVLA